MVVLSCVEKFKFFIGGFGGTNYEVLFNEYVASYGSAMFGPYIDMKHEKVISEEEMALFVSRLKELGVTRWKRNYVNDTCDGTQWELEMVYNDSRKKKIYGSNVYPGTPSGSNEYTVEFIALLDAIESFIGEPEFFDSEWQSDDEDTP